MKRKKLVYSIGILASIIIILILALFLFCQKTNKERLRFEEEFGLELPEETRVIFSEDDHGAMGDGIRLYIYQLTTSSMIEFRKQDGLKFWWLLPFDKKLSLGLLDILKGVSNQISGQIFVLGMADHNSKWETTPFEGKLDELLDMVKSQFGWVLCNYNEFGSP